MVNGLIAQLIKRVSPTGLGVFAAFNTSAKSILTMIGYIIKNKHMAIGMDTRYIEREFSLKASSGIASPMPIPAPIQSITQSVRYFSKKDNFFTSVISLNLSPVVPQQGFPAWVACCDRNIFMIFPASFHLFWSMQ